MWDSVHLLILLPDDDGGSPPPASDSLEQAVVPTIWVEKSTLSADSANLNDILNNL